MNRWIPLILIAGVGCVGVCPVRAQGERASAPEERAKQYVAELERIRRSREAVAKAEEEARLSAARAQEEAALAAAREEQRARLCQIQCEIRFRSSGRELRLGAGEVVLLLTATDASRAAVNAGVREDSLRSLRGLPEVLIQASSLSGLEISESGVG